MPFIYSINGVYQPHYPENDIHSEDFKNLLNQQKSKGDKKDSANQKRANATSAYESNQKKRERIKVVHAHEIMTKKMITLLESDSIFKAKETFRNNPFRHLPILNSFQKLVGIISDRDLYKGIQYTDDTQLKEIMTKNVLTALENTAIRDIAFVMIKNKIHALPILDKDHEITGILTTTDILKALVKDAPLELWI